MVSLSIRTRVPSRLMQLLCLKHYLSEMFIGLAIAIPTSVELEQVCEGELGRCCYGHTNRIHAGFALVNRMVGSGLPVRCRRGIPAGVNRSTLSTCPPPPPARLSGVVAEATTP